MLGSKANWNCAYHRQTVRQ